MIPAKSADGTSSQPGPRRRVRKPAKRHSPDQAIRLEVRKDGSFVPADLASRRLCKDRGMTVGSEFISYLYEPRDKAQWRVAHQVGTFLTQHVEAFHGLSSHDALKKVQKDGRIALLEEQIDLGTLGVVTRSVPESLAFGFIDNTRWTEIWRQMCTYIRKTYFGEIDADAVEAMDKLMVWEQAA